MALGSLVMPLHVLRVPRIYWVILEHIKDLHGFGDITVAQAVLEPVRLFGFSFSPLLNK